MFKFKNTTSKQRGKWAESSINKGFNVHCFQLFTHTCARRAKNKDNSATTEFFKENHMQGCNEYNAEINYFSQIGLINLFSDHAVMSENQIFEFDNYKVVYKAGSTVPTQLFKNGQNIKLNRVTYSTNQVPIFKTEIGTIAFILEGNDSFERGPSIDRVTFFINFENNDSCVRGELSTYNKNLRRY